MEDTIIPYELPERENHSFFFIDQRIDTQLEAKLHQHDAWELYCVVQGRGTRVHYLMVAFSHSLIQKCIEVFPELRNRFADISFPTEALIFGPESSRTIRHALSQMKGMDELGRLCTMFRLLPTVFSATDYTFAGKPVRIDRDVRRMQQVSTYVMAHYVHPISLDDIAAEVGMNRSAFCTYFKRHKGMTFSQFVTQYRLNTACGLLKHSQKSVSEICYLVGFSDLPHFIRVFTKEKGVSPGRYRKISDSSCPI